MEKSLSYFATSAYFYKPIPNKYSEITIIIPKPAHLNTSCITFPYKLNNDSTKPVQREKFALENPE